MNQMERYYIIHNLLECNRFVTRAKLIEALDHCKPATFDRTIRQMRELFHAPIKHDKEQGAYCLNKADPEYPRYNLPGLWFNAEEIFGILTLQQYFEDVSPNLLGSHLGPLREKLRRLVDKSNIKERDLASKVRIVHLGRRKGSDEVFRTVAYGLMQGKRLSIRYYTRYSDIYSDREISPLRLVHYRENWYLDAWCHGKDEFRTFAVDAIEGVQVLNKRIRALPREAHDRLVQAGYGIFSGEKVEWATLRFSKIKSRWVAYEEWHPLQKQEFDTEDRYILKIPYSHDEELIGDILRHGSDVEVIEPEALKKRVMQKLTEALERYEAATGKKMGDIDGE